MKNFLIYCRLFTLFMILTYLKSIIKIFIQIVIDRRALFRPNGLLKQSDTLYIFGSGSSINQLSDADLSIIRDSHSIGINHFFAFDFRPTYYFFEFPRERSDAEWSVGSRKYDFCEVLNTAVKRYSDTIFIERVTTANTTSVWKRRNKINPTVRRKIKMLPTVAVWGSDKRSVQNFFSSFNRHKLDSKLGTIFQARASVVAAISFGRMMDYQNIVLCGVDLNSTEYFWEDGQFQRVSEFGVPTQSGQDSNAIHSTMDPNVNSITAYAYIELINDFCLKPKGIGLYVASASSALYPMLPVWDFE